MQARVDEAYAQFTKDVARGRGVTPAAVKGGYGEGRALTAKDAKDAGLIDRIGTMDDTLSRLTGRSSVGGMRAEGMTIRSLIAGVAENTKKLQADVENIQGALESVQLMAPPLGVIVDAKENETLAEIDLPEGALGLDVTVEGDDILYRLGKL